MIKAEYKNLGLGKKYFIVKLSYTDPVTNQYCEGLNAALETKLTLEQVSSILAAYCKENYKLTICPVNCKGNCPPGYYELYCIDSLASEISRIRFIKHETIEM